MYEKLWKKWASEIEGERDKKERERVRETRRWKVDGNKVGYYLIYKNFCDCRWKLEILIDGNSSMSEINGAWDRKIDCFSFFLHINKKMWLPIRCKKKQYGQRKPHEKREKREV